MRVRAWSAGLLVAWLVVAGCGHDGGGGGGARALAARLPAGGPGVAVVDLDAARQQLHLAADTDVDGVDAARDPARARLRGVAGLALPYLARAVDDPMAAALHTGEVHQVASTGFGPG